MLRRFLVLIFLVLNIGLLSYSQTDSFATIHFDSCKVSLIKFYQQKTKAEQEQYNYKTKFTWLKYLPNIGWSFLTNSPIITTSFNDIANQANQKRINRATIKGISLQNEVLLNQDILIVESLIREIENKKALYHYEKFIYNLSYEQFVIIESQYQNKEIPPLSYISAKATYMQSMYNLKRYETDLQTLINECIKTAKQTNWVSLPAL